MNKKIIKKEVRRILTMAIENVYEKDMELLTNKVSERCVCACLALHFEQIIRTKKYSEIFKGYYVDVEYDRMKNGNPKLIGIQKNRNVCDLLIHSRGQKVKTTF